MAGKVAGKLVGGYEACECIRKAVAEDGMGVVCTNWSSTYYQNIYMLYTWLEVRHLSRCLNHLNFRIQETVASCVFSLTRSGSSIMEFPRMTQTAGVCGTGDKSCIELIG